AATVQCDAVPTAATLTATDNCGDATVTFDEATAQGNCPGAYTITRTWTATDLCGNVTSHVQVITVEDTTAPTFVEALPTAATVQCDAVPTAATLTATDNCGEATVTFDEATAQGSCPGAYTITRTWTATDLCGNVTSHVQVITVEDTTVPVFVETLPEDITAECDNIPEPVILTAMDSCGEATVAFSQSITPGACEGDYVITRTWTATDLCGNDISHDQVIIVQDTTGPIASPFDENISVSCEAIPAIPELTFTDACSTAGVPTFNEETTTISSSAYVVVRTWEVADSCGNISTFTQTITVNIEDSITYINSTSCRGDITPVDLNSLLPDGTTGGVWIDVDNTGALNGNIFTPSQVTILGNYILRYEITDGACPRIYEITMNVNDDCLVFPCEAINIYNAMSPNGDGLNEFFNIENIENTECYPSNSVEIYNRWGVLVYDVQNYDNSSKAFRGVSEGRATVNKSAELPTGTYFYIIQYTTTDGNAVNKSGYLYLTR
ncbi:gliding motility-associated C-terminal domain-containing protein, partial [Flavobacterium sp.]|uniref:gliding motility-associated C-terminal domain-containing protein n=1 Tax=Flavobacterium sp. TaxID=239 RepID=UPI00261DE025